MRFVVLISYLLFVASCTSLSPDLKPPHLISQIREIKDFSESKKTLAPLIKQDTLLVFDVDDTLLTADHFFGSDRWYDWQRDRTNTPVPDSARPKDLFRTLGHLLDMGTMSPTQPTAVNFFNTQCCDSLILTARGEFYRSATLRDLRANNFKIDDHLTLGNIPASSLYQRFPMKTQSGRTAEVEFSSGVYMIAGMDKGKALLKLLDRLSLKYKNIVLFDDKHFNLINMQNALKEAGINYYGFLYTRVDKTIHPKEVKEAISGLSRLESLLNSHFR